MTTWNESAPQNRQVLKFLDDHCQNGIKYDNLKTENVPNKPLYFSSHSKRLEPDSKYCDLIGAISAFNCLYLGYYFPDRAEICQ